MLIDSHSHLNSFEDLPEVVERARENKVERIIAVGGDLETSKRSVEIAREYASIFASVGVHPHDAGELRDGVLDEIKKLAENRRVVAVGETGLDFYYMNSPREVQIEAFRKHIALAKELNLPVVVHVRDAHKETPQILMEEKAREVGGVIHCFTGDYEAAKKYLNEGFYISFSGIITFKDAEEIREAARKVPLDRMLVETDSPYLTPYPFRGKRNEPAYVRFVAEKIAEIRGVSVGKIAEETTNNANRLFILSR